MKRETTDYDAVVVGAGPNGLAAAITMQQAGWKVLLIEAKPAVGGGMRTAELTLPGFKHDICSAIHPLALSSPFFSSFPLADYGLEFVHPPVCAAHPFDGGRAAAVFPSFDQTALELGTDQSAYSSLLSSLIKHWPNLVPDILGPLKWPADPLEMAKFGMNALTSAQSLASGFTTPEARALWAGMAAHGMQALSSSVTSAVALVLLAAAHTGGWPVPVGGSQSIANAMAACFKDLGGTIETGREIKHIRQLPSARATLFDLGPPQLLQIAGHLFSPLYRWQLEKYRYGMGVFKIDWALDAPIPFSADVCRYAGTVHLGNSMEEIAYSEWQAANGHHARKPFVLLAQQSIFDPTRAPEGKQVAWAYCHVPFGSVADMTDAIESQVERFAPGFRERILARHVMNTAAMQHYNANYIGGDINGGVQDLLQLFSRPALRWSPYRTGAKGIYICSSSTPPGGGVHGMCGYHAAARALRDAGIRLPKMQLPPTPGSSSSTAGWQHPQ